MIPEHLEKDLIKNREILIIGEIEEDTVLDFIPKIRYINRKAPKNLPIYIYLTSIGGDVDSACAIVDEIKMIKAQQREIIVIGMGIVASAAIFILCAGSKRYGTEYTQYMLHPVNYTINEYHKQNKVFVMFMDRFYDNLMVDLAVKCGKSENKKQLDKFLNDVKDNIWLDTESAIEFKLIEDQWPIKDEKNSDR